MLTVSAAIISKGNKVLIARRSAKKHLAGYWEFPGGKTEDGETDEECLKREIKEELGINIKVEAFFMENIHQYEDQKILLKAFFCEHISGNFKLNDHDQIEWVEKGDFYKYIFAPADMPFVKSLLNKKN
jgi:8-oxo-dGTP diphosphatase